MSMPICRMILAFLFLPTTIPAVMQAAPFVAADSSESATMARDSIAGQLEQHVSMSRLVVVAGGCVTGVVLIHTYQQNAWWKGARGQFHVQEDLNYACNVDKIGHFYGAGILTYTLSKSLQWANVGERDALLYGAVGSTLFQTYVEIEDGFARDWGFDRVDFLADILGAWYPVAQYHVPFLRNFSLKASYSPKTPSGAGAFPGQQKTIFDDYEGQTFWLSLKIKNLLPGDASSLWPGFLCLGVGCAVRDNLTPNRHLVWLLAPDLDMTEIIPPTTPFLKTLGEILNFIHLPMPAVQIAPGVVWYGLYF